MLLLEKYINEGKSWSIFPGQYCRRKRRKKKQIEEEAT
jgi:hypothetical protein